MYIGQTSTTLSKRAQSNGSNYKECRRFYDAIVKYGWESFEPSVLYIAHTPDEADEVERLFIREYMSNDHKHGYNIMAGGCNPMHNEETRQILSEKARQRYSCKENNPMYGKKHTSSAKLKMSENKRGKNNPMYGSHWTETQKLMCGNKGKKLNISDDTRELYRERMRKIGHERALPVLCIDDNIKFPSLGDAANYYGVSISTLCGCLRGHQKTCRGKHFQYITNNTEGLTTIEKVTVSDN